MKEQERLALARIWRRERNPWPGADKIMKQLKLLGYINARPGHEYQITELGRIAIKKHKRSAR
jgi:Mn-dependent DtxR family transcriptional regulator